MAKKNKSKRSSSPRKVVPTSPVAPQPTTSNTGKSAVARSASQEFNPDYSYVIADLKRIAILAASFIAVLVALSFILD